MQGYKVIPSAGIIGSGNILVTIKTEIICPKASTIAIYMKDAKCLLVNKLSIPQKESKSKVAPLKKKDRRPILKKLKIFTIVIDRKGGQQLLKSEVYFEN